MYVIRQGLLRQLLYVRDEIYSKHGLFNVLVLYRISRGSSSGFDVSHLNIPEDLERQTSCEGGYLPAATPEGGIATNTSISFRDPTVLDM